MNAKVTLSFLLGLILPCFGQGTVNFSNDGKSLVTVHGYPMPDKGGFVQLLWAPQNTHPQPWALSQTLSSWLSMNPGWNSIESSIKAVGPVPGRFLGGTITVPTAVPGARIDALVVGWVGNYATFDNAMHAGNLVGFSQPFSVTPGNPWTTPPGVPAIITGPNGFRGLNMTIPEPSPLKVLLAAMPLILTCRTIFTAARRNGA